MQSTVRKGLTVLWLGLAAIASPDAMGQDGRAPGRAPEGVTERVPTAQEALRLQAAQRWEEAAAAWAAIAERDPQNGQAVFNLGYCLHLAGRLDEALPVHRRAAEFEEYRGIALYNVACAHALLGEPDAAIEALAAAQGAGYSLGNAMQDSDLDSLHEDPRFRALLARPAPGVMGRVRHWAGRARSLYVEYAPVVRQNFDTVRTEAEAQAQVLAERVMRDPRLGPVVRRIMRMVQGPEPAGSAGRAEEGGAASAAGPTLREAQRLQQAGQWGPAAAAYAAVLEREPDNVPAVFGHAYCLHMSGDYAAAIAAHQRAASFPPIRGIALYNLGCAYALTGDSDRAFEALDASHQAGFDLKDRLGTDPDLVSLREDPRFQVLVARSGGGL